MYRMFIKLLPQKHRHPADHSCEGKVACRSGKPTTIHMSEDEALVRELSLSVQDSGTVSNDKKI